MLNDPTRRSVLLGAVGGVAVSDADTPVRVIAVSPPPRRTLTCGLLSTPCAVGRGGVRYNKREGDGATPAGQYPLRRVMFRKDRIQSMVSRLPISPIDVWDGWSTDPADPHYNQQIKLPQTGPHEKLWRDDNLYDVIIVIGYNDAPVVSGKGSAIFLHVARPGISPTDGCVAIPLSMIRKIVELCDKTTIIDIKT